MSIDFSNFNNFNSNRVLNDLPPDNFCGTIDATTQSFAEMSLKASPSAPPSSPITPKRIYSERENQRIGQLSIKVKRNLGARRDEERSEDRLTRKWQFNDIGIRELGMSSPTKLVSNLKRNATQISNEDSPEENMQSVRRKLFVRDQES